MKNSLVQKYHILEQLVHLCILLTILDQILHFSINLFARCSSSPTKRHWNGIKHILRYLRGTIDMRFFYSNKSNFNLVGFADSGYLTDPHKSRSQTGYLLTCGETAISWHQ